MTGTTTIEGRDQKSGLLSVRMQTGVSIGVRSADSQPVKTYCRCFMPTMEYRGIQYSVVQAGAAWLLATIGEARNRPLALSEHLKAIDSGTGGS